APGPFGHRHSFSRNDREDRRRLRHRERPSRLAIAGYGTIRRCGANLICALSIQFKTERKLTVCGTGGGQMKRLLLLTVFGVFVFSSSAYAQRSPSARKLVKQGVELFGKNNLDGAIADYEVAAELDRNLATNNHDMTQAYLNRGYIRSNRLDLEGALADFDRAINLDPNDAEAYFKRGRAFLIIGNAKFAIADFDKSISLDDHNPLVYAERGFARQTQGENSEAKKDFERGLKLNNDLRLMLDLHLLDLQMQMKEMQRRQAATRKNIA